MFEVAAAVGDASVHVTVRASVHGIVGARMEGVVTTVMAIRTIWTRTQTRDFTRLADCRLRSLGSEHAVPALPCPIRPVPQIRRVPLAVNPMVTASMKRAHYCCCFFAKTFPALSMLQLLPNSGSDSSRSTDSNLLFQVDFLPTCWPWAVSTSTTLRSEQL